MHIIASKRVSTVGVFVIGLLASVLAATGVKAANVTAEAASLVVGWDDVTDSTSPGETVSLGGGLSWSGLTTTEITIHWYLDGSYKGGVTLTDVDEDNPGFYMLEGYGPTWVATAGPHTMTMVVDPGNAISESNETDNQVQRAFTISDNGSPTDISLSASSINENVAANSTVGTLSTTDPDTGNTFTYTLVAGAGSTDNAAFNISDSSLRITASPNYEAKSSYTVRVRTTDQGGLWYEEAFTITINNVNETPTDANLSNSSVAENQPTGTAVGALSTTDPDAGNTFTYTLVSGAGSTDNASFTISGSTLQTAAMFNYEAKNSYGIRIQSADQGGLSTQKAFTINITNVDEQPPSFSEAPSLSGSDMVIRWGSITNHKYTIHYSTNMLSGFAVLQSNISGTPPINTHTDSVTTVTHKFWKVTTDP